MLALGKQSSHLPLQNILTVPYFQVFIFCEMMGKSGTAQRKSPPKLSKLSLLDTFVFSYYKYVFLNLFLSLSMSLLAHRDTSKGLRCSFFLLRKKHLCLSPLHAVRFLAHLTHASQMLFLLLLSLCIMNKLRHVSVLFTVQGGQAVWQGSTAKKQ